MDAMRKVGVIGHRNPDTDSICSAIAYADLKNKIGSPDLLILFTSTVSHKMVHCAVAEAERKNIIVERSHSSSANALNGILEQYA